VEASPRNAELLRHSAAINGFTNLRVVQAAVSDRPGILSFCPEGPFGHVATNKFESPTVEVPALPVCQVLKEVGWDRVDFIKLDVEGSEIAVIDGMAPFLARADAPPILYESNSYTLDFYDKTPNQLKARLESLGYRNFVVGSEKFYPVAADDFQLEVVTDYFAVKQMPPILQTWEVGPPFDQAEIITRFAMACSQDHLKVHIARMLRTAPAWLLEKAEVIGALEALGRDPKSEVRAAAAWAGKWLAWYKWKGKLKRAWKKRFSPWLRKNRLSPRFHLDPK
jgi:FkbM family methyltransferase